MCGASPKCPARILTGRKGAWSPLNISTQSALMINNPRCLKRNWNHQSLLGSSWLSRFLT